MAAVRFDLRMEGYGDLAKLAGLPGEFRRAALSAMSSLGWHLQQAVKTAGRYGLSAPLNWPELNPHTGVIAMAKRRVGGLKMTRMTYRWKDPDHPEKGRKRVIERIRSRISPRRTPMSRLVNAVRYVVYRDSMRVVIGFLAPGGEALARKQAQGFTVQVTPRMRRFLFGIGFPLAADTAVLTVPPRPLVGPVYRAMRPELGPMFSRKFFANLERYRAGGGGVVRTAA